MSDSLTPIPTPPSLLWRQVRLQYLPVLVFVAGVVTAALLWTHWVAPPTMVAEVETIRTEVRSARPGALANVKVTPFQTVHAGDLVAHVITTDPRVFEASLAVMRAELDAIRFTLDPVIGQQRIALDYERLLLDVMRQKVELASLQAQLFQAQGNFARANTMYASKLIADDKFEEAKNLRDGLESQVKAQNELIARMEPGLNNFTAAGQNGEIPTPVQGLRAALKVQEEKLRLTEAQMSPVPLLAPVDGIVTMLHRQPGETVVAGEPLIQITGTRSERIIGFIRQPISRELKPGMAVEVRTRTFFRQSAMSTVAQVGLQYEAITPTLLAAMRLPVSSQVTEFGLRVNVPAPPGLAIKPGEQVDLILRE